jgi:hypothetical protein
MVVLPDERAPTFEELSAQAGPRHRYVVAELDGALAGRLRIRRPMRDLNTHLGFFTRAQSIRMQAALPLTS